MSTLRVRAAALLGAVAVTWGAIPLIVREEIPAIQLVAARVWLGAAALLVVLAATGRLVLPAAHRGRLVVTGMILAAHWLSFFVALKNTTVAVALATLYLGPVVAAALAPRFLGESVGVRTKLGLAVALAGTLAVVRPGSGATATGLMAAAVAAATLAALMLVAKPAAQALGGLTVATAELVVAAAVLTPWALQAAVDSAAFWPQFIVLGVFFTGVAGAVFWSSMRHLPVAAVGVLMYLEPASAVVWAAAVLGEVPDVVAVLGIGMVIAGGALAALEVSVEEVASVPAAL